MKKQYSSWEHNRIQSLTVYHSPRLDIWRNRKMWPLLKSRVKHIFFLSSNCLMFCSPYSLHQKCTALVVLCKRSHRQYVNKWAWLLSNKILFTKTGSGSDWACRSCFAHAHLRENQSMATYLKLTQLLELAKKDFKAAVVTMHKDIKENMLIIKEQISSPKSNNTIIGLNVN